MTKNPLATKPVKPLFLELTIPALIAQVVNLLYNMVDRIYIGHIPEIGATALTGVSISMPIIVLISAFSMLIGMGGSPRASMAMGEGRYDEAERMLNNSFTALFMLSIGLMLGFYIFRYPLLEAFGASSSTIVYAEEYLGTYLLGTPFIMLTLGLNLYISAQGFAKTSMMTTLIGAALNIILDPVFIFFFKMDVQGAALATIISQGVSCFWVLKFLRGEKSQLKLAASQFNLSWKYLGPTLALGFSPFIMQSTESVLQVVFNTSLAKYGGDLYVGTMAINALLLQFIIMPLTGITQGGTPIISYNYGAKSSARVKESVGLLVKVSVIYTLVMGFLALVFPRLFIFFFTKDPALTEAAEWTMRVYGAGIWILGVQVACQQSFIAFGQAKISIFLALFRKGVLLIPLIYTLPHFFENQVFGVYLAEPIADITAGVVTGLLFYRFVKKLMKELKEEEGLKEN